MFTANLRDIHTLGKGSCDCLVITTYAEKVKLAHCTYHTQEFYNGELGHNCML